MIFAAGGDWDSMEECIGKGILADILRAHRAEVTDVLLKEYDEELLLFAGQKIKRRNDRRQELPAGDFALYNTKNCGTIQTYMLEYFNNNSA